MNVAQAQVMFQSQTDLIVGKRKGRASGCHHGAACGTVSFQNEETAMTTYTVGLKLGTRAMALAIEAEDALLAALKTKIENPAALITYVRKSNRRGDRRHPHEAVRTRKAA